MRKPHGVSLLLLPYGTQCLFELKVDRLLNVVIMVAFFVMSAIQRKQISGAFFGGILREAPTDGSRSVGESESPLRVCPDERFNRG